MLLSLVTYAFSQSICDGMVLLSNRPLPSTERGSYDGHGKVFGDQDSSTKNGDKDKKSSNTTSNDKSNLNDHADMVAATSGEFSKSNKMSLKGEDISAVWSKGLYCVLITIICVFYTYKTVSA